MNHFAFLEATSYSFLNLLYAIIKISRRYRGRCRILNLDNQNWIHISIVLLITILVPMIPFILPFIRCRLKHSHIFVPGVFFRIGDDDSILQESRSSDLIRCNHNVLCIGCNALYQCVKSRRCCRHADNHRHSFDTISRTSFKELLHDGCSTSCLTALHTAMCFINDEIQPVTLITRRVGQRLPDCILAVIRALCKI